jgi:hypothetical protein
VSLLAIVLLAAVIVFGIGTWVAMHPTTGRERADVLGLRGAREIIEQREALEAEDLAQLLEAHNRFRRRRGESERTVEDVELLVAADAARERRRRDHQQGDDDLDEMLAATNARRRARGLPERSLEQLRGELSTGA